jgi:hypothetical protein
LACFVVGCRELFLRGDSAAYNFKGQHHMTELSQKGGGFVPSLSHNCIIEEQPDHLVVAVRIPKATIAANCCFTPASGAAMWFGWVASMSLSSTVNTY